MIGIGLDDSTVHRLKDRHDIHVDASGNLVMVTGSEAVGQLCKQRLLTYLGEWFLDSTVGVPWFQNVFVRPFDEVVSEAIIKRTMARTPGVVELVSFEMDVRYATRHLAVLGAELRTEFDDQVIEVNL